MPPPKEDRHRVLAFLTNFLIGGTERQVSNLVTSLDRAAFDLYISCLGRTGPFLRQIEALGVPLSEYPIRSLFHHRTALGQIRFGRYLRRNRIGLVHSFGFYANVFSVPAARLAGVPVVIASIRDMGDPFTPMQRRLQRTACMFADCILANSDAIRRRLVSYGYRDGKIAVIRNGIGLPSTFKRGASIRQELQVPHDARLVVVLSRLNPLKGVEYFLQAAAAIAARFTDVTFLIVGDGAHRAELERQTERLGLSQRAIFTGFRTDAGAILSEAALSVLPSLSEGLSNTLLESMAEGVPVVATDVGGNPEVVDDGATGLLVPPRDAHALASAMAALLGDPARSARLSSQARHRVKTHFTIERMVRETERLYLRLAGRHRLRSLLKAREEPA